MEVTGGAPALLSVINLLSVPGKTSAPAVVELDFSTPGFIRINFANMTKSLSFSSKVQIEQVNGGPFFDQSKCYVHLRDLINCLSCCGGYDTRSEIHFKNALLQISGVETDGSRIDFEIRSVYGEEVQELNLDDDSGVISLVMDSEVIGTAFLQCYDASVSHVYFACQTNDSVSPLMLIKSSITGSFDTEVSIPQNLGKEVSGLLSVEMLLQGKDVGSIYQFLSCLGSPSTEMQVSKTGIRFKRKLATGIEGILNVLGSS